MIRAAQLAALAAGNVKAQVWIYECRDFVAWMHGGRQPGVWGSMRGNALTPTGMAGKEPGKQETPPEFARECLSLPVPCTTTVVAIHIVPSPETFFPMHAGPHQPTNEPTNRPTRLLAASATGPLL